MTLTRREFGIVVAESIAAAAVPLGGQTQRGPGPVLDIADWSYFWYGVERVKLARGTVVNGGQMFVERWIPSEVRHPYSVVLIHGGYGQGSDWLSTPAPSTSSGQAARGWVSAFLEDGYKVYVIDRPGQGRNPFQPFVHGLFDAQAPTFEKVAGGLKKSAADSEVAQIVASMNQPMATNAVTQDLWRSRGVMLLDDIGASILVAYGDGDLFARATADARPSLVKGVVAVESMEPSRDWIKANIETLQ